VSGDVKIANLVKEYLQTKEKTKMRGRRYVGVESRNEKTEEEGANSFQKETRMEGKMYIGVGSRKEKREEEGANSSSHLRYVL